MSDIKTTAEPLEAQAEAYGIDPEDARLTAQLLGPDDSLGRLFQALDRAGQAQRPRPPKGLPQPQR